MGRSLEPLVPLPETGRVFRASRRIRLSDRDADGRLRLDGVARYLQDVASDDVDETGWGAPEHLWVVRHLRIEVVLPPVDDDRVELATWSSGLGVVAAGRRMSLVGDRGGRVELDSVWVHLGRDGRPARITEFGVYAEAAGERVVSTKLVLPEPEAGAPRRSWKARSPSTTRDGAATSPCAGREWRSRPGLRSWTCGRAARSAAPPSTSG